MFSRPDMDVRSQESGSAAYCQCHFKWPVISSFTVASLDTHSRPHLTAYCRLISQLTVGFTIQLTPDCVQYVFVMREKLISQCP